MRRFSRWDAIVAGLAALAYAPTLGGSTVWDDEFLTTRNPYLAPNGWRYLLTHDLWVASAKHEASGYYRPLATATLALNRFLGNEPWSYHLGNVLVHALVAVALRQLVLAHRPKATLAATLAALAFGLAPITSEAVSWLSGRFDLLGTLFLLVALVANARKRPASVVLGFAAAIFSKETFLVAPVFFALDDVFARRTTFRATLPKYVGLGAVAALYAWARSASAVPNAALSDALVAGEAFRAYTGCVALYAGTFAHVIAPSIFHVYRDPGTPFALGCAGLLLAGTTALAVWARRARERRGVLFAWIACLVSLVPVGLTAPRLYQTGDRYAYLAAALLCVGLGLAIDLARRRAPLVAAGAALGLLAFTAAGVPALLRRHADWRDEETLFRAELERDPSRSWAAALLGEIEAKRGHFAEAEKLLEGARGTIARPYRVETALCYVYLNESRLPEARERCDAALAIAPDDPRALINRASVRLLTGDLEGALDDARHTTRVKPASAEGHAVAAEALHALGRDDEARAENDAALAIAPGHARSLQLRSVLRR